MKLQPEDEIMHQFNMVGEILTLAILSNRKIKTVLNSNIST